MPKHHQIARETIVEILHRDFGGFAEDEDLGFREDD
jgi:hypothetical protein